jgi:hypothetical protein
MMELEYHTEMIYLGEEGQRRVNQLVSEGWEIVPGTQPVAVYHLVRMKAAQAAAVGGFGTMQIDESKIHIIRGGKVVG